LTSNFATQAHSTTAPHDTTPYFHPLTHPLYLYFYHTDNMGVAFDYAPDRPENIDAILNGLDRYNPETTTIFQEYVAQQCENQTYDCYANLALLKLYVRYPRLAILRRGDGVQ
jgi:hypothetical protein